MVVRASASRLGEPLAQVAAVSLEVGDRSQMDNACHPVSPPGIEFTGIHVLRQTKMEVDAAVISELWDCNPRVSTICSSGSFHVGSKVIEGLGSQLLIGQENLLGELVGNRVRLEG